MKRILLLVCVSISISGFVGAQTTAQQRCDNLNKGINLSNWLEAYWQTNWPNAQGYNKDFLVQIKKSGITSIRLPICFAQVTDTVAPYTVNTNHVLFTIVDSVIAWTDELDMKLLIDNHHGWELSNTSWRHKVPRMAHLWAVLARRYATLDPEQYYFELINEPPLGFSNDSLQFILHACVDSIRPFAPQHSIVASPAFASIGLGFMDFQPLADTNIIYSIHCYDPYPFTHQGFSWSEPYYAPGVIFPGSPFDFLYQISWQTFEDWNNLYHLPVFLGEFGSGTFADEQSRCNWIDSISRRINKHEMSWFYWDAQYDFQMFNGSVIHKDSIIPCFRQSLRLYDDSLGTFSVNEPMILNDFQIFPNPTSDTFTCQINGKGILYVMDQTGRLILNTAISQWIEIDTKNWKNGMYFLKIASGNQSLSKKIIINR